MFVDFKQVYTKAVVQYNYKNVEILKIILYI